MIITKKTDSNYLIELTETEKNAMLNSIKFIINDLGEDELQTRTGFDVNEYASLSNVISQSSNPTILNEDGISMLRQALNEVGQGIHIPNFEQEIGVPHLEAIKMLRYIHENR